MRSWSLVLGLIAVGCAPAASPENKAADDPSPATEPSWHGGVKQLIAARCANCHQAGEIAPFTLTSLTEVRDVGAMVKDAVVARRMPPWKADPDCNQYHGDRSLSDAQIQLISDWVDGGMNEGEPADGEGITVDPIGGGETVSLRSDTVVQLAEAYMPTSVPDDYRCFVLDWPHDELKYVTGYEVWPDNKQLLHHLIAFKVPPEQVETIQAKDAAEPGPGYECFGSPGGSRPSWIGSWVPGGLPRLMPLGTGIPIEPGSKIVVQTHYNLLNGPGGTDRSAMSFQLADSVEKVAMVMPWVNPQWIQGNGMAIPAGETGVEHSFAGPPVTWGYPFGAGQAFDIHAAGLHMHLLGQAGRIQVDKADGQSQCLLQVNDWDFGWQGSYALKQTVRVEDGDLLKLNCTWNNTESDQAIVEGERLQPQDVQWGEGTTDEMCLGVLYVTPASD